MSTHPGIPTALTASALDSLTSSRKPTTTRTILDYLSDQSKREYPIERLPPKSSLPPPPKLPPPHRTDYATAHQSGWAEHGSSGGNTALRLISHPPNPVRVPSPEKAHEPAHKRASLVSQMKRRMSRPHNGTETDRPGTARSNRHPLGAFSHLTNTRLGSTSPVLKSRKEIVHPHYTVTTKPKRNSVCSPSLPPSPASPRRNKRDDQSNKENIRPTSPPRKRQRASTATKREPASTLKRVKITHKARADTESSSVDSYDELAARQFVPISPHILDHQLDPISNTDVLDWPCLQGWRPEDCAVGRKLRSSKTRPRRSSPPQRKKDLS